VCTVYAALFSEMVAIVFSDILTIFKVSAITTEYGTSMVVFHHMYYAL